MTRKLFQSPPVSTPRGTVPWLRQDIHGDGHIIAEGIYA